MLLLSLLLVVGVAERVALHVGVAAQQALELKLRLGRVGRGSVVKEAPPSMTSQERQERDLG